MIKLSDYVIKRLEETGTRHMFLLPGGGAMHLNDSLGKSQKIQYVGCLAARTRSPELRGPTSSPRPFSSCPDR